MDVVRNVVKVDNPNVDDIKKKLERYRGRIPNIVLEDLYERLKGKEVSEEQIERIVKKIEDNLVSLRDVKDLIRKLDNLEGLIKQVLDKEVPTMRVEGVNVTSDEGMKSARLDDIPNDAKSIMILLKWIEFLIERVGYDELEGVLDYYVDIGWISENVMLTVLKYAKGIKLYHESSDWRPVGFMSVKDHITSLMFIEALRTGRFDREVVMSVERDVSKIKKEIAELHGV